VGRRRFFFRETVGANEVAAAVPDDSMLHERSQYELERAENIRNNNAKLAELGLLDGCGVSAGVLRVNDTQPKQMRRKIVRTQTASPQRKSKRRRGELASTTDDTVVDRVEPAKATSTQVLLNYPRWSKWILTNFDDRTPLSSEELAGLRVPENWLEDFETFIRLDLALSEENARKVLQQARAATHGQLILLFPGRLYSWACYSRMATDKSHRDGPSRCVSWHRAKALPAASAKESFANRGPSRRPATWIPLPWRRTNGFP